MIGFRDKVDIGIILGYYRDIVGFRENWDVGII